MPIKCEIPIRPVAQSEFNRIDYAVMAAAYEAQNHFGRLCEEEVYENDVKERLLGIGFSDVCTQVEIWVTHESFEKLYLLDLVVNQMLYELKAVKSILPQHEAQVLNYAALLNLSRVKLLNFGSEKVKGKLLGAPFGELDRTALSFDSSQWQPLGDPCKNLYQQFESFARDIGGYLGTEIYNEALTHFCGGEATCLRRLPVKRGDLELGHHACRLYTDNCAFVVTTEGSDSIRNNYRDQLQALLDSLPIRAIQWINIFHCKVSFVTLVKNR